MSTTFSSLRANVEARARQERLKLKVGKKTTVPKLSHSESGLISQQKLAEILRTVPKPPQPAGKETLGEPKPSPARPLQPHIDNSSATHMVVQPSPKFPSEVVDKVKIEEAVQRLIDLNKDSLSESQLVDVIASFYFVTNKYLSRSDNADTPHQTKLIEHTTSSPVAHSREAADVNPINATGRDDAVQLICNPPRLSSPPSASSLRERKQLQWMRERAELEGLGNTPGSCIVDAKDDSSEQRQKPDDVTRSQTPVMKRLVAGGAMATQSAPPARDFRRFQRRNLEGLGVGVESEDASRIKERQRQEWLADLDRQVEERRVARERERYHKNHDDEADFSSALRTHLASPLQRIHSEERGCSQPSATLMPAKSEVSFGRGKGLADLEGRQNADVVAKRMQQLELQEAYAEQMREKEAQRRLEKEREAREEAVEAARIEEERARMAQEQEAEDARRRNAEAARQAVLIEAQERAQRQVAKSQAPASSSSSKKPAVSGSRCAPATSSANPSSVHHADILKIHHNSSRTNSANKLSSRPAAVSSKPPRAPLGETYNLTNKRTSNGGMKQPSADWSGQRKRASFHWKTPLTDDGGNDLVDSSRVDVICTESHLIQKTSAPSAQHKITSDFMSAITDPDFACAGPVGSLRTSKTNPNTSTRTAALEQVTRIKQNLALRQNELRSMQCGDHGSD